MPLLKETYDQQLKLAKYCRTGVEQNLLGVKSENLHHYRRLVFNIASDNIETAYPITKSFLDSKVWDELVYDYFAEHKCQAPQVWRMPLEFYEYCVEKDLRNKLNLPFLNDLLYFEWLELEVHTMDDIPYPVYSSKGDWMNDRIALNPEYKLIQLTWPVHTTAPTDLEGKQGDYFLMMYREKESGSVQFMDLSIFYTYILEQLSYGVLLKDVLVEANTLFQINDIVLLKDHALTFIEDLKKREFVLGFLQP
jgi:hypothetical protein